jgi:hypothetical protein
MDAPATQEPDIEISTADPWSFAEEVMFGEQRYLIKWTAKGHYYMDVATFWLEDESERAEDLPADALPDFTAVVKWDECGDWRLGDGGYIHTCSPDRVESLCGAIAYVQRRGLKILEAREALAARGLAKWD